jgi:hypothetical protein
VPVRALLGLALAAGCSTDPCEGVAGSCIVLHVESGIAERIDQLELDLLYGARHATVTTMPDGVGELPVVTAIELETTSTMRVGIGIAGKLGGVVLGTAARTLTIEQGVHRDLTLELTAAATCVQGGFYCGGNKLAGDESALYMCNTGGVPLGRGFCEHGCSVNPPPMDDACRGGPATCIEGGFYCGGNKLDGDPQSRYTCSGGKGIARQPCADGCVIAPAGSDDHCR